MFSKFEFKAGKYDGILNNIGNTNMAKFYSLKMALEGKKMSPIELSNLLESLSLIKN